MLGRLLGRTASQPPEARSTINLSQYAALWQQQFTGYSPVPVSVQRALTHAASSACIDVLASAVSTTPLDVIRPVGNERLPMQRVPVVLREPSLHLTMSEWLYQFADGVLTDGNGFGLIVGFDGQGRPTGIEPISASRVGGRMLENGVKVATVDGQRMACWPHGELWHVPGKLRDGQYFADSPVQRAAATIGGAIAARDFGARFFGDGAHPGGLITSEQELTAEQAASIKKAFLNAVNGSREPAVLGSGLEYTPLIVNEKVGAEGLALMQFAIEEACRFWRVPPAMVYASISGQNVTYANSSQADVSFLKYSVEWLFRKFEEHLFRLVSGPSFVRFNRKAFLRSDALSRGEYLDKRLRNKTITVNEYWALEDEPPFDSPEFDEPGIPGGPEAADPSGGSDG